MKCRHCTAELVVPFIDLGSAPPSNAYLTKSQLSEAEKWFPLRVLVCTNCWLVQTEDFAHHEDLFSSEYAYFSSYSQSWLQHAEAYVTNVVNRFGFGRRSLVVEVAANDGYLLQYVQHLGIPCLGIEPTASTARTARLRGLEIREAFFGVALAEELVGQGKAADLTIANNVLAHVPDINDFLAGFACLLKPEGVATFEFPHLLQLVGSCQFDTIYHEHFSYLSLTAVCRVFEQNGLTAFDVEECSTHGGSLRVYAQRIHGGTNAVSISVAQMLEREALAGMTTLDYYRGFQARSDRIKDDFVAFLLDAKRNGKRVAAYGAAAKGNTLINYAGVRPDLIEFVVDRNPVKQGKFMPGSHIPIVDENHLRAERADYLILLPWNLRAELMTQLGYVEEWAVHWLPPYPVWKFNGESGRHRRNRFHRTPCRRGTVAARRGSCSGP